jgi:hypothetical protein
MDPNVICSRCARPATFASPADLCDECWCDWWVEDYPEPLRTRVRAETLFALHAVPLTDPDAA